MVFGINTITELHEVFGYKKPKHPLISVINLSDVEISERFLNSKVGFPFYNITLKTKTAHPFKYGREYFDFSEGSLFGTAPNQLVEIEETCEKGEMEGWGLYFHPDLTHGYNLIDKLSDYAFFSYETKEALHLSEKEKSTLNNVVSQIIEEYESNMDEFSQDLLISNLELLFNHVRRFYSRQFLTRKSQNISIVTKLKKLLKEYYNSNQISVNGLPKVHYFAEKLNLSSSYLSDLLKNETGKNAQDTIHTYLIEKAKNNLLNTNKSISEIAFELGFEYPQYFSRFFKKETGLTPKGFRLDEN
ncbi:AraC family transcriptional regulator [Reichenbachiella versicolor]|uniref:AraC family transcriptional regulator n=1 Tax=Reichenbachiella versicolor TaxID=1821036 RepID=UPI001FE94A30|nr:AraC family transcriptional regulator [Reichenbachiella versicolor]